MVSILDLGLPICALLVEGGIGVNLTSDAWLDTPHLGVKHYYKSLARVTLLLLSLLSPYLCFLCSESYLLHYSSVTNRGRLLKVQPE